MLAIFLETVIVIIKISWESGALFIELLIWQASVGYTEPLYWLAVDFMQSLELLRGWCTILIVKYTHSCHYLFDFMLFQWSLTHSIQCIFCSYIYWLYLWERLVMKQQFTIESCVQNPILRKWIIVFRLNIYWIVSDQFQVIQFVLSSFLICRLAQALY